MKFDKQQLDRLATFLGAVAGICGVLVANDVLPPKIGGSVGGIATVLLGIITQRPASAHPTTEEVEDKGVQQ